MFSSNSVIILNTIMGPPGQLFFKYCLLSPLHAESICTWYQDLISPTQSEQSSGINLTHLHNSPHWPSAIKSSISCWVLECWQWRWDPRNVKPSRGSFEASMEMRIVRGFGFLLSGKIRDKEGKREATRVWCSLS